MPATTTVKRTRCPGHGRHWFAAWQQVGLRTPKCVRCGAPNPRPLSEEEQREYEAYLRNMRDLYGEGFAG